MLKITRTLISVYYAYMLEYRAEIFFWILSGSLPIILMGVWIQAANNGGFSLSSLDFARYFFAVFLVRQVTNIWVIWEFEQEIIEGTLSFRLLQPLDPVWHHVARHLAEKLTRLPLVILFSALFFWLYPKATWSPDLSRIILTGLTVVLSFILAFLIQYNFSMLAFWMERATSIQQFWSLLQIFFSGIIAPLDVFPAPFKEALLWTPFPYINYFPSAMAVGLNIHLEKGLGIMFFWIILCYTLNRWLWRKGLRQYSGMGA